MDLKEQDLLGDDILAHWYYATKARALKDMLRGLRVGSLVDVGAGSGVFGRYLVAEGMARTACCVDPGYTREHEERLGNGGTVLFRRRLSDADPELALMMDVIEHVDDDEGLIREYAERLPAGGHNSAHHISPRFTTRVPQPVQQLLLGVLF